MCCFLSGIGEKYHSGQSHFMWKLHPPDIIYLTEPKWMKEDFWGKMKPSISPTCTAMVGKSVGEKANKQTNDTSAILGVTFWETCSKGSTSNLQPFLPNRFPKRPISSNYINRKITLNEYVRELKR